MPYKYEYVILNDYRKFEYAYPGSPIYSSQYQINSDVWTSEKSGNWDRPRPTPLRPSPYKRNVTTVRYPRLKIEGDTVSGDWRRYSGTFVGMFPYQWRHINEVDRLRNEAILDMLSNLKDQSFNAGVAMAEAKGTAQLAFDAGQLIVSTVRLMKKGAFKKAYKNFRRKTGFESFNSFKKKYANSLDRAELGRNIPQGWTYYHFGIKPTIQDIQDIQNDWFRRNASGTEDTSERFKGVVRGKAKFTVRKNDTIMFDIFDECQMNYVDSQSMRVYQDIFPKDGFLRRLSQMGATNVPEALWNGIPFSWAVDYFTSFGDWLSALDSGIGWEFGTLVESYRRKIYADANTFYNVSNPSVPNGAAKVERPYKYRETELNRVLPVTFYPPMYRTVPMLSLKGPSQHQWSMLTSVLQGFFGGRTSDVVKY